MVNFKKTLDPKNVFATNNTYYFDENDMDKVGETPFFKKNSMLK